MATLSITEEEASMPKNPDLELAQKRFLLTLNDEIVPPEEKQTIKDELFEAVKKDSTCSILLCPPPRAADLRC
jgi:hypothetical protein